MERKREILKQRILDNLIDQGFEIDEQNLIDSDTKLTKDEIRHLHKHQRIDKFSDNALKFEGHKELLAKYFANGSDIDIKHFSPELIKVQPGDEYYDLFKYSTLYWSVPVSEGYGRRLKYVVIDRYNNKLVGIFALGDPVFNLKVRDDYIGWDSEQRKSRLYNVMDMYIAGSLPPYSNLLGGKLMSLLATSNEVRKDFREKYSNSTSVIQNIKKRPELVLITTSSSLGRSSIYNRIKNWHERMHYIPVGFTSGWGHFHLSNGTYEETLDFLRDIEHPIIKNNRYGNGPNWKLRVIRTALEEVGLSNKLLNHGISRQVFLAPLAKNFKEFLNTDLDQAIDPQFYDYPAEKLSDYFKKRWLIGRAERDETFRKISNANTLKTIVENGSK